MMDLWKGQEFKAVLLAALLLLTACGENANQSANQSAGDTQNSSKPSRLDLILKRGKLVCGVSGELPGFSFVDRNGKYSGLDVDICKAIAAALFDNPEAVDYRNLNAKERFTALQSGEIDILSRNTTWTVSRSASTGMDFAPVVFYDGQGIMVSSDRQAKSLRDLKGTSICAQVGTTAELNLTDQMRKQNLDYKPVTFEDVNATFAAYEAGRCQSVTADRSSLVSRRTRLAQPQAHVVMDLVLSKEPLAPAVLSGDPKWSNAVKTIIYGLIAAEELGISSQNLANQTSSQNGEILRFLGKEGDLGKNLGLSNDFAARAVKQVGNYGEIYDRNLGKDSTLKLERGLNKLWTNGGLMYAPPFR